MKHGRDERLSTATGLHSLPVLYSLWKNVLKSVFKSAFQHPQFVHICYSWNKAPRLQFRNQFRLRWTDLLRRLEPPEYLVSIRVHSESE